MSTTYVENGKVFPGSDIREWAEVRLAEIAELRRHRNSSAPREWMKIESAPKDGTLIIYMYDGHAAGECFWDGDEWYDNDNDQRAHATHWIPRPEPPQ